MGFISPLKTRLLLVSAAVVALDQWTKHLVETHLAGAPAKTVIPGFLDLIFVRNTGIAFGLFAAGDNQAIVWLLALLGVAALSFVLIYFLRTPDSDTPVLIALALILGGALGNLTDRIGSGSVTDFIEVYIGRHHWPTFNVADSAITVGIALMALDTFRPQARVETAHD